MIKIVSSNDEYEDEDHGEYEFDLDGRQVILTMEICGTSGTNSWTTAEITIDGVELENVAPELFSELAAACGQTLSNPKDEDEQWKLIYALTDSKWWE